MRRPFILAGVFLLMVSSLFGEPIASSTQPGTASTTGTLGAAPDGKMSSMSTPAGAEKASAGDAATTKTSYTYKTDDETEMITAAIERYNHEFPNEPITEINQETLYRLQKNGFLREIPKVTTDLVLREGKVLRRVKEEPKPEVLKPGKTGNSLDSAISSAINVIDTSAPKTLGTAADDENIKREDKVISIKNNGQYQERNLRLPRLPASPPLKKDNGIYAWPRPSRLTDELKKTPVRVKPPTKKKSSPRPDPGANQPTGTTTASPSVTTPNNQ